MNMDLDLEYRYIYFIYNRYTIRHEWVLNEYAYAKVSTLRITIHGQWFSCFYICTINDATKTHRPFARTEISKPKNFPLTLSYKESTRLLQVLPNCMFQRVNRVSSFAHHCGRGKFLYRKDAFLYLGHRLFVVLPKVRCPNLGFLAVHLFSCLPDCVASITNLG